MPEATKKIGPELGIKLEREQPAYTLPDTVVGHVFRKSPLVASKAVLTVAVVGRSKSRMVVRHGSWGRIYRGRFPLLNEEDNKQTLLQGPIHIPMDAGEEQKWPFAVTLPAQFDAGRAASGANQDESFLTIGARGSAMSSLPPSFLAEKWGFGEGMGCFVEYFLKAELTTTGRGSTQVVEAIQPLVITTLHRTTRAAIGRWKESRSEHTWDDSGASAELNLEQSNSASQRRPTSAAKPPGLGFDIVVHSPKTLELDQAEPISLLLRAEPEATASSRMGAKDIIVKEILLNLVASTSIKCHGRRGARHAHIDTTFNVSTKDTCSSGTTLRIPWSGSDIQAVLGPESQHTAPMSSSQTGAMNAGRHFQLRLPDEGIYESFRTHNICQEYRLEWNITVEIAGQSFVSSGAESVEIIAPSRENAPIDYDDLGDEALQRRQSTVSSVTPPVYGRSGLEQPLPPRPRKHDRKGGSLGLARLWEGL